MKRRPALSVLSVLTAVLASCAGDPTHPVDSDPGPGVPNVGSVVRSAPDIFAGASMAWVDPDERIAFHSWDGDFDRVKVLALGTGEESVVDGPASGYGVHASLLRTLVTRSDGQAIYYVMFADDGFSLGLRSATLEGGSPTTLDPTGGYGGLALSPDGSRLAHHHDGALAVLDLATMEWAEVPEEEWAQPVSFSPDGSELLVLRDEGLVRVPLAAGTPELLDLEAPGLEAIAVRWDESGIRVLAAAETGAVEGFTFPSGTGPATRFPLSSGDARVVGGVLAEEGDGFAIWTERCIGGSPVFGGCSTWRITVYAGRFGAGQPTALGSSDVDSIDFPVSATSALLFSPDGSRLYYALEGMLYVADVP